MAGTRTTKARGATGTPKMIATRASTTGIAQTPTTIPHTEAAAGFKVTTTS